MALLDAPPVPGESTPPDDGPTGEGPTTGLDAVRHDELFDHCRRCAGVNFASAKHCSHCDFDVADHNRQRLVYGAAGMLLTLTGVLAPLGLLLLWHARYHRVQAARGVAEVEEEALPAFLRQLIRRHLTLAPTPAERGEFTRGGGAAVQRQRYPPEL